MTIKEAVIASGLTDREIAEGFGTSVPTVKRWREGINEPHPAMHQVVFEWLEENKVK